MRVCAAIARRCIFRHFRLLLNFHDPILGYFVEDQSSILPVNAPLQSCCLHRCFASQELYATSWFITLFGQQPHDRVIPHFCVQPASSRLNPSSCSGTSVRCPMSYYCAHVSVCRLDRRCGNAQVQLNSCLTQMIRSCTSSSRWRC